MHFAVCCRFLISFVIGGGSSAGMLLYRTGGGVGVGVGEQCFNVTLSATVYWEK
jgi:hypothetical protein